MSGIVTFFLSVIGLIFLVVLINILFKFLSKLHKIFYIIFFYLPVKLTNKILYWYFCKESVQLKLKKKGEYDAVRTLWKTFKNMQIIVGCLLIILYTLGSYFLFREYYIADIYILTTLIFYTFIFFVGKPSYKVNKDKNQDDEFENIEEIEIEGLGDIDFGDMIADIDFSIDISIDL